MWAKKIKLASYGLAIISAIVATPLSALASSIYYIGNSLTDSISYQNFSNIVNEQLGEEQPWGRHIIFGAPLEWIWNHPDRGLSQRPYGRYPTALNNYSWDFLSLQPFDRSLLNDIEYASRFINLAKAQNPDVQVLIHGRWLKRDKQGTSYSELWDRLYTNPESFKKSFTRDYLEQLTTSLGEADLNIKDPILVPIGEVMYELDQKMTKGKIPGFDSIFDIYIDRVHLDNRGRYLTTMTYLATMYGVNPATLDGSAIANLDPKIKQVFDRTIWEVVNESSFTNSEPVPEPFTFFGVGTALTLGMFFKRKISKP
ncbi:hypothetical protein PCC7424_4864 [Gloeothece citriformis PCC 7424]|uniref:PEP-CTERM protein-sorting domain-containing protein n=1 Tax=Gloeothece citriformis (strain PCC 7424) TaxID=65393 RepID=B7KEA3_GLOC7|nr:PEP-CTERM sorting domain-containing protein [Gloeothece citriformis]ACK73221.1 hypothetical protein PCC7424_4864 [Gloeothece citriformis PCC 7424]